MTVGAYVVPAHIDYPHTIAEAVIKEAYSRLGVEIWDLRMSRSDIVSGVVTWTASCREDDRNHSFDCVMPQSDYFLGALTYGLDQSGVVDRFLCRTLQFMGKL